MEVVMEVVAEFGVSSDFDTERTLDIGTRAMDND